MLPLTHTPLFEDVLKGFYYKFADVYVFDGFVVSEIKEGVTFSYDKHAKRIIEDVTKYTNSDGSDLIYISHRINSYSVKPMDWLKFFNNQFNLRGYGVVGYSDQSFVNTVMESLFFNKRIKRFKNLDTAIKWAKSTEVVDMDA
jgi:hypothetical protein